MKKKAQLYTIIVGGCLSMLVAVAAFVVWKKREPRETTLKDYDLHSKLNDGDVENGSRLFEDPRLNCSTCHSVDGSGASAGPDLYAAGDKYSRADLLKAVADPSESILQGYETVIIEDSEGEAFQGILKEVDHDKTILAGANNSLFEIPAERIFSRRESSVSLMPEGLHKNVSVAEFTDLLAYLESLRQPLSLEASRQGTPNRIPKVSSFVKFRPLFDSSIRFETPVAALEHPGLVNRFLVAEQMSAKVWLVSRSDQQSKMELFANYSEEVLATPEKEGLLGLALHPDFVENGRYFVMYDTQEEQQRSVLVVERSAGDNLLRDRGGVDRTILKIEVATNNHHGGAICFGPDGFLYVAVGDGGPHRDPKGNSQNLGSLLGKVLRLDVDEFDDESGYSIPEGNPFVGQNSVARPEVYAYGFREPWRMSFDLERGDLWLGDVGYLRFEEINLVRKGLNYGWNVQEGFVLSSTEYRRAEEEYQNPVVSFSRKHCSSITAGYVYRGRQNSDYDGVFVCGDWVSKRVWGLRQLNGVVDVIREIGQCPGSVVSFGQDRSGELYVVGHDDGIVYEMDFRSATFD